MIDWEPWLRAVLLGIFPFIQRAYLERRDARIAAQHDEYWEEVVLRPQRERALRRPFAWPPADAGFATPPRAAYGPTPLVGRSTGDEG